MAYKSKEALRNYQQGYRQDNREDLNEYSRERRRKTRRWAVKQLGGKCVRCGGTSDLHFDQVRPCDKSASIGKILNRSRDRLATELKKCQLLCGDCHRQKTSANHEHKNPAKHGSSAMYSLHKCRCGACRLWKRNYDIAWKLRRAAALG